MHSNRMEWIDLCKAIGIYLVVLGHFLPVGAPPKLIIYTFHVPLFFILSGFLLKVHRSWHLQILHRAKILLIPYFGFATISLVYYIFSPISYDKLLELFFYLKGKTIWNDPLWFLFTLFIVDTIAYSILYTFKNIFNNAKHILILSIITLILGYFIYNYKFASLEFLGIDKAIIMLGFYFIGYFLNRINFFNVTHKNKTVWFIILVLVSLISLYVNYNNNISVYHMDLNNYWFFILAATIASISVMILCTGKNTGIHKSASNHTIFIMCTHYAFLIIYTKIFYSIDSALFCIPVLCFYIFGLAWWDKLRLKKYTQTLS